MIPTPHISEIETDLSHTDGVFPAEIRSVSLFNATLFIHDFSPEQYEQIQFILARENNSSEQVHLPSVRNKNEFCLDLSPMKELFELKKNKRYLIYIQCITSQKTQVFLLQYFQKPDIAPDVPFVFADEVYFPEDPALRSKEHFGIFFPSSDNRYLLLSVCTRNNYLSRTHSCSLKSLRMRHGILKICIDLEPGSYEYSGTEFSFRNKLAEDAFAYTFDTVRTVQKGQKLRIHLTLDLHTIECKSLYWDIFVLLTDPRSGKVTEIPVNMSTPQRMFQKFLYNGSFRTDNGFFLYPYYTGAKTLAFVYRKEEKYDGMDIVFKEFLAIFLYRIARPYWDRKHICLVSEKFSSMAQDNGYYFFKHCMDEDEEKYLNKKIFYIISKDSPDHYKVDPYKNRVLDFMSIRHMIYIEAADLIVSSDSRYHTYAMVCRHSIFNRYLRRKKFVFLQHGVIALKKVDNFYGKGMRGECDLFVVSTNAEKQTIIDYFGYEPDEVINTGLPRWDVLQDKSEGTREIMIMPTWRNWLDSVPDSDFEQSDYFRHYMGLLNSRRFSEILEKYDLQVNFYLHAKFQEYVDTFNAHNARIHLISFGEVAVNEMLMRCRMLITDYSSVSWDVLYQDKPVLFYQFDLDKYNEAHGSYLDMHTELFGARAENEEQLLDRLEETICDNFKMKPEYEQKRMEYLQFKDNRHSRHICEEIKKRYS
ncbi:CDP-glycerol glycerophosphotransferase family protein [Blautia sp. MSJ-19]|uniref:CDP-glycerol glycerophosphotransferase family protein n=1 Tax=Blautia sp. MSJ-19 TaxID=2841517 RepID=UPI001C0F28D7|nr:CDP-glycerol glycerophosphotransferase family protein [Blautia sp. MSJ-19]MBU5482551.1 CDP-glycerol glycerophosphotransferase family protein [Blautia sp. MSJ-19]